MCHPTTNTEDRKWVWYLNPAFNVYLSNYFFVSWVKSLCVPLLFSYSLGATRSVLTVFPLTLTLGSHPAMNQKPKLTLRAPDHLLMSGKQSKLNKHNRCLCANLSLNYQTGKQGNLEGKLQKMLMLNRIGTCYAHSQWNAVKRMVKCWLNIQAHSLWNIKWDT